MWKLMLERHHRHEGVELDCKQAAPRGLQDQRPMAPLTRQIRGLNGYVKDEYAPD